MRTIAILGFLAALGGLGCASTGAGAYAAQRDPGSLEQTQAVAVADEVVIERLFGKMSADQIDALLAGRSIKLSSDKAVLLAEVYATYGSKKAARDAMRRVRPASEPSVELVAAPADMGGLAANGEGPARR